MAKTNLIYVKSKRRVDLTGKKFNRLTVIEYAGSNKWYQVFWYCKCDCGRDNIVLTQDLTSGTTNSCGCYHIDKITKYSCNHNFFETIDSEEKAYWLGFISGDGYISGNELSILLKNIDTGHLYKFKNNINYTGVVENRDGRTCRIRITSNKIVEDLNKLGIVNKKSLILKSCDHLLLHQMRRHYWRGFVDADGCLSVINKTRKVSLAGTMNVCENFRKFIISHDMKYDGCVSKNKKITETCFVGKNVAKLVANILYKDSTIYLDRKYEKYLELMKL